MHSLKFWYILSYIYIFYCVDTKYYEVTNAS